jgi:mutator protein MutT
LSRDNPRPFVHVVAAAVIDAAGRVLIAQRPAGKHMAGGWEFPGGKLEPGEGRLAGLTRELREELGISIATPRPLIRVRHAYPSREVLLDIWVVTRFSGEPHGLDGQALRWCTQDELAMADLLPADKPIVAVLRLPERLTQWSSPYHSIRVFGSEPHSTEDDDATDGARVRGMLCADAAQAVAAARSGGAQFLVLREQLAPNDLAALCQSVSVPVYARALALEEAWTLGASGTNEIIELPAASTLR